MTARDAILSRIPKGEGGPPPDPFRLSREVPAGLDVFAERLRELGGKIVTADELARLDDRAWCVDPGIVPLPAGFGPFEPTSAWSASVGVTRALAAVAETGTLLLAHDPSDHRLASLAPPLHVALLDRSKILSTLEEAFDLLPHKNAVLVTGPSRTADIEGVLVRGVHGPRELWVVLDGD